MKNLKIAILMQKNETADCVSFPKHDFDREKMKKLVYYICMLAHRLGCRLEKIKLEKAIWFIETMIFNFTGQQAIYETFKREENGPVPVHLEEVLSELIGEHKIIMHNGEFVLSSDEDEIDRCLNEGVREFAERETDVPINVLLYMRDKDPKFISNKSHGTLWKMTEMEPYMRVESSAIFSDTFPEEIETPECLLMQNS